LPLAALPVCSKFQLAGAHHRTLKLGFGKTAEHQFETPLAL